MNPTSSTSPESTATNALRQALDTKFGQDIAVMDLRGVSPIADFFVIATGNSLPHLQTLADATQEVLESHGLRLSHTEGVATGNWILLDFGAIIVHLFDRESRHFYNLERVWGDARPINGPVEGEE